MALEKLNLRADSQDERFAQLKQLYPEIFSDGNLNIDALKEACGLETEEDRYYGLYWPGKNDAKKLARKEATGTLEPVEGDGVNEDTTHNIYIEGDNLEVLRTLKKSYQNRVKMIYIDPPYNTGNDFIYPDNYSEPVEDYLRFTGQMDDKGNMLVANPKDSGKYHRAWLKMMYSRLSLAYELLSDGGLIFISIDDNEQANLKLLCNEIFSEANFVTQLAIKMSEASGLKMSHVERNIPKLKEYIFIYKKGEIKLKPIKVPKEKWDDEYKTYITEINDEDLSYVKSIISNESRTEEEIAKCNTILCKAKYCSVADLYKKNGLETKEEKDSFNYEHSDRIFQTVSMGVGATTEISSKRTQLPNNIFFLHETSEKKCYLIKGDYDLSSRKPRMQVLFAEDYLTYNPCDFWQDIKTTGLDNEGYFPFKNGKKPLKLLERLLYLCTQENDIIMDFFSGSGSSAQAVLESNLENKIQRKFIMVQIPEDLDKSYEKASAQEKKPIKAALDKLDSYGKKHLLTEIGKQRIRLAGEEYSKLANEKSIVLDVGFKVYRLAKSNFTVFENINGTDKSALDNLFAAAEKDPLTEGWKERKSSVVAELCLRHGFVLDSQITKCPEYKKNEVLKIVDQNEEKTMFVCLDEKISEETAKTLHLEDGEKFICLDSAIGDQLKVQLADKGRIETI